MTDELNNNEDCFALSGQDYKHLHCGMLKTGEYRVGQGCGGCPFYKTRERFESDRIKAAEKVRERYGEASLQYELAKRFVGR